MDRKAKQQLERFDDTPEGPYKDWMRAAKKTYEDMAPLSEQLRTLYPGIETPSELMYSGVDYSSAVPILRHWLRRINNLSVKTSIVKALGQVPNPTPDIASDIVREIKKALLVWPSGLKRDFEIDGMVTALTSIALKEELPKLVSLMGDVRLPTVSKYLLVKTIAKLGKRETSTALIHLLSDSDEFVVVATIRALSKLKARDHVDQIKALTSHQSPAVQKAANKAVVTLTATRKQRHSPAGTIKQLPRKLHNGR